MSFLSPACTNNTPIAVVLVDIHHLGLYSAGVYGKELGFSYSK